MIQEGEKAVPENRDGLFVWCGRGRPKGTLCSICGHLIGADNYAPKTLVTVSVMGAA